MDDHLPSHLGDLADGHLKRIDGERYLRDFLEWRGGSFEPWLQVMVGAVGNEIGWGSKGEVPNRRTDVPTGKFGDGAVVWLDGCGVLVEVKACRARKGMASFAHAVAVDMNALAYCDWPATLAERSNDQGVDEGWSEERKRITRLWGLSIVVADGELEAFPVPALPTLRTPAIGREGALVDDYRHPVLETRAGPGEDVLLQFRVVPIFLGSALREERLSPP